MNVLRCMALAAVVLLWQAPLIGVARAEDHHPAEATSHGAADGHGETAGHGEGSHSDIWGDLPLWSLVAFLGFVFAIYKLGLWNLMVTSMKTRENAEVEAIATAESHLSEAQGLLRSARGRMEAMDQTVREILAEADRDATYTREEIARIAEREAQASVERARVEIDRVKNQSLNDIFETLADKVATVAESRLKQGLQDDDQERLIRSTLDQLAAR